MDRIFGLATEYWIRPPPRTYPQTGLFSRLLVASRGSGCPSTYYYIHYVAELPGCALLTYMQGWEPGKMDIVFGFPTQKLPRRRPPLLRLHIKSWRPRLCAEMVPRQGKRGPRSTARLSAYPRHRHKHDWRFRVHGA